MFAIALLYFASFDDALIEQFFNMFIEHFAIQSDFITENRLRFALRAVLLNGLYEPLPYFAAPLLLLFGLMTVLVVRFAFLRSNYVFDSALPFPACEVRVDDAFVDRQHILAAVARRAADIEP